MRTPLNSATPTKHNAMNLKRNIFRTIPSHLLATIIMIAAGVADISALSLTTYAPSSVLSSGRWVKVNVSQTGIHLITESQLRSWGFTDPSKVNVYGYGGGRISDVLSAANYIDDLPQVQSVKTSRGIFFYAQGPVKWTAATSSRYIPSQNPFSTVGCYFLSDVEATQAEPSELTPGETSTDPVTEFDDRLFHEVDRYSPGMTGHQLLGEDFRLTPSQTFTFDLPDRVEGSKVWMQTNFFAKTLNVSSKLTFTANGQTLPSASSDDIRSSDNSSYTHGRDATTRKEFEISGERLTLGITHSSTATVHVANLDFISINYRRALRLRDGSLQFYLSSPAFILEGASASTRVWDVTDPLNIYQLSTQVSDGKATCVNHYTGKRSYIAWDETATYPSPDFAANIGNQDLHAAETPDMVIFSPAKWIAQAQRIADHHIANDEMTVLVVDQDAVFNEFSSGVRDVAAFRKMLKMFWDRGKDGDRQLRFALFFGRGVFDNRLISEQCAGIDYPVMPLWQTDTGADDNSSYTTDDIFAFLNDGSGSATSSDRLCIAVGRIPARSVDEAKNAVNKFLRYVNESPTGAWRNHFMLVADDENQGIHMLQSDKMQKLLINTDGEDGDQYFFDKVYIDAYEKFAGAYPDAREKMFRLLNEGVMWWNYVGHAGRTSWTAEKLLTSDDLDELYLKRYPILYAATCDFMRWDEPTICGTEVMFNHTSGGIIAAISATRPVYINDNGTQVYALARQMLLRDDPAKTRTIGEIYMATKNDIRPLDQNDRPGNIVASSNRLRYALMGNPAMKLVAPENRIKISKINGKDLDPADPPTLMARQEVTVEGSIYDPTCQAVLSDFNGDISVVLYDAERSITTLGNGNDPSDAVKYTYEDQGDRLLVGGGKVENGHFSIKLIMPAEIADNYRPAALNMSADADDGRSAMGCERNIYAYGTDENAEPDTEAPVIEYLALNHTNFRSGDTVNDSPMVLAKITDNRAINLSTAGVGHQMTLTLDDNKTYTDVSTYFTPIDNSQAEGNIAYPIDYLTPGYHTLKLRVWDSASNLAESTIEFSVDPRQAPTIYDVYADCNPASVETNFYISHNRPDATATVTVTVYNLLGSEVWSSTETGRSDMFSTAPLHWDLRDNAGHRVNRGIYLYRATITTDGEIHTSAVKRLAVTAR